MLQELPQLKNIYSFKMIVIDTSALIRFFTKDIPGDAEKVKNLIEQGEELKIPDVVFPEIEYVLLSKTYNASREKILKAFKFLILRKNIIVSKEVKRAILLYEKTGLDIADCIIVASAKGENLFSFDKKLIATSKNQ